MFSTVGPLEGIVDYCGSLGRRRNGPRQPQPPPKGTVVDFVGGGDAIHAVVLPSAEDCSVSNDLEDEGDTRGKKKW
jgi:hypothetical protein